MGDPIRVVMLKAMAEEMRSKNLLAQCRESGKVLLAGLQELEVTFGSIPNTDLVSSFAPFSLSRCDIRPRCTVPGEKELSVPLTATQSNTETWCCQLSEIKVIIFSLVEAPPSVLK